MAIDKFPGSKTPSLNFLWHLGCHLTPLKYVYQIIELITSTKTFQNVQYPNVKKYVFQSDEYPTQSYSLLILQ